MTNEMNWKERNVIVTGGASFIGSHLVDRLCARGAIVTVFDNLSSGTVQNLSRSPNIKFLNIDLECSTIDRIVSDFRGNEIVFHLAATHGGRGYIDSHPADVCSNFSIDHNVFKSAYLAGVDKVVFASSACVYPPRLQENFGSDYLLTEADSDAAKLSGPLGADLEYGWAKLMAEVQLNAFIKQYGLRGAVLRFVTAYGERENETHSIVALIHKAHERMNPFVVWGNGEQSRDFTYVSDIVEGTLLAAEKISDGTPINLGTGQRFKLKEVATIINDIIGYRPRIVYDMMKPVGVANRALDIRRAQELLGWKPKVALMDGLRRTVYWYVKTHPQTGYVNESSLVERMPMVHPQIGSKQLETQFFNMLLSDSNANLAGEEKR
ncbi:MAG: NAD-dependent epimerase/dehydratase family protein [Nitrososphaerales archaeon]